MDNPILHQFDTFTPEQILNPGYGDGYLFFVGRDDVHGVLLQLLKQEKLGLTMNMFGFDDDELNQAVLNLVESPLVSVQISLDKSQAGGVHEKILISSDQKALGIAKFTNSFCVMQSETHQISHTKGGVFSGQGIYFEGSTNWSNSGEGTGISLKVGPQPTGFKAQNNTLFVSANSTNLTRFKARLDAEHKIGLAQQKTTTATVPSN